MEFVEGSFVKRITDSFRFEPTLAAILEESVN